MGEVYALVTMAKVKHPNCQLVLSGVLRRSDVSWGHIRALNDRFNWIVRALGITFADPNSWAEDRDFARDGLHLNGRGKRRLIYLYARVSEFDVEAYPGSTKLLILEDGMPLSHKWMGNEVDTGLRVRSADETSAYRLKGKLLVVLQVNCRSSYNKALDF
jgi:hypothetical protein